MKNRKRWIVFVFLAAMIFSAGAVTAGQPRAVLAASQTPRNKFVQKNGKYYYYNSKGKLVKGWYTSESGEKYFFNRKTGAVREGIQTVDGDTYCFSELGLMRTGWVTLNGKTYYFSVKNGKMYTGWKNVGDDRYYFGTDGAVCPGMTKVNKKVYCFDQMGKMLTGVQDIGDNRYFFDKQTGERFQDGILKYGKNYYYFGPKGKLRRNQWIKLDSGTYYAKASGALAAGWATIGGSTYFFEAGGRQVTGLITVSEKKYYLDPTTGILARNEWIDDTHYAESDGVVKESGDTADTMIFQWPLDKSYNYISSYFGGRESPGGIGSTNHQGIDIPAPTGTKIYAAAPGTVLVIQTEDESGGAGNYTIIDHGNGVYTEYMHQSQFAKNLKVGKKVKRGQVIGYVGSTGNATGAHLHLGILINNIRFNPLDYFTVPS